MNFSMTESDLNEIRAVLSVPQLMIETSPQWSSLEADHHERLHKRRDSLFAEATGSHSLSHTQGLGGIAYLHGSEEMHIGFDIELDSRVRESLVRRICATAEEVHESYSSASLWVAKEAAFKSLQKLQQPPAISSIQIGNWSMIHSQFETFRLINLVEFGAQAGRGCIIKKPPYSFGVYVCMRGSA